ncbi:hypothetical protein EVAR_101303_1, partial [Eumeta japonica]
DRATVSTVVSKETVEDICVCKCIRRVCRSPKGPVAAGPSKQALFERDELKNTLHPPDGIQNTLKLSVLDISVALAEAALLGQKGSKGANATSIFR